MQTLIFEVLTSVGRFKIQARDESIGNVCDFVVNDETWSIQNIVMHTGAWLSGKNVLIAPEEIERISWNESTVFVKSSKEELLHAPRYDESALKRRRYPRTSYDNLCVRGVRS